MYITNLIINSIVFLALLVGLSGCVPLPIPWKRGDPLYTKEQIAKIQEGQTTRQQVVDVLGEDGRNLLKRLDDRYWVYYWTKESGMWFGVPLLPLLAGDLGPISFEQYILFLEFDSSGLLISKQLGVQSVENPVRYCTANNLCLEHKVHKGYRNSGMLIYDFDSFESAFTINGSAKDSVPWPTAANDRCVAVLWADAQDWKYHGGVLLALQDLNVWLPANSYITISLPIGLQTVFATRNYSREIIVDGEADFNCEAGQTIYMKVGNIRIDTNWLRKDELKIILSTIDQETGRRTIANMPRLLPP